MKHRRYLYPLLTLYILAGTAITPFHADEADHLFKARDYVTYFVIGDPGRLRVEPPVVIDSEPHIRLLTGTTAAYLTGLLLWQTGYTDLDNWNPPWYYPVSLEENLAAGRRPAPAILWRGRLASAFLTMLAGLLLFRIAEKLAGERAAVLVLVIFITHPVILLNGRRIMQEGALLCFMLLVVYVAINLTPSTPTLFPLSTVERGQGGEVKNGFLLGLAMGLALTSKPTALIPVAGVLGGLLIGRLASRPYQWRQFAFLTLHFALLLVPSALIYLLLTPAIWSDPIDRILLAAELRAEVLHGQTAASTDAYAHPLERGLSLVKMPFPGEVQYYESPQFVGLAPEIRAYQSSPWHGMMLPALPGMGLALIGMGVLLSRRHPAAQMALIWIGVTVAGLVLAVPLGWQRYYLPWTVIVILLAGVGLNQVLTTLQSLITRH